jgi:hypothetical protein
MRIVLAGGPHDGSVMRYVRDPQIEPGMRMRSPAEDLGDIEPQGPFAYYQVTDRQGSTEDGSARVCVYLGEGPLPGTPAQR